MSNKISEKMYLKEIDAQILFIKKKASANKLTST